MINFKLKKIDKLVLKINSLESIYEKMSDEELKSMTDKFKEKISRGETMDAILPDAFAVVREASKRVLGLRHYDVQLIGGILLHQGNISEMKTGEGKTLVAVCPAYLNALGGQKVHIITVNEYLAQRDKNTMEKVFSFLGLKTGVILSQQAAEEKRNQYSCDIIYGTNSEFGFDYLRNNIASSEQAKSQSSLDFAIIDEADSILIDEARTPLIITEPKEKPAQLYTTADLFAKTLNKNKDLNINEKENAISLTESGINKAEKFFSLENYMDIENLEIAHHINQAIRANYMMKNNVEYIVKDGRILIVDSFTGRIMDGKRFNQGLHQAIEAKEGVEILNESKVCATITYQNFFRMYKKLSGMTGTAKTEEEEFKTIYKMHVYQIPTNKPIARIDHSDVVYKTKQAKINALVEEIKQKHEKGQPMLVGTSSIESSEEVSSALAQHNIPHRVLNAKHHEEEANIIAQAGRLNSVTIATNMAGRGTDILLGGNPEFLALEKLKELGYSNEELNLLDSVYYDQYKDEYSPEFISKLNEDYNTHLNNEIQLCKKESEEVLKVGGLYVIGTERHESRRIDDQLRGRAGRQGDVGESKFFISLEDNLLRIFGGEKILLLVDKIGMSDDIPLEAGMLTKSIRNAQKRVESSNFSIRKHLIEYDNVINVQREIIYTQRNTILSETNLNNSFKKIVSLTIEEMIEAFIINNKPTEVEINMLLEDFNRIITESNVTTTDLINLKNRKAIKEYLEKIVIDIYEDKEIGYKEGNFQSTVKTIFLNIIDIYWSNHIDDMSELRQGINLRAIGQQEPTQAYAIEGSDMFINMNRSTRREIVHRVLSLSLS